MKNLVYDRLLKREVGTDSKRYSTHRGIYGDRQWIENMDIVNELAGHTGCVNALRYICSSNLPPLQANVSLQLVSIRPSARVRLR